MAFMGPKCKRKFWVRWGEFGNQYSLRYTESPEEEQQIMALGYERIAYRTALELCREESWRYKHDRACSGNADSVVYRFRPEYIGHRNAEDAEFRGRVEI